METIVHAPSDEGCVAPQRCPPLRKGRTDRRDLGALLGSVILALALAACGSDNDKGAPTERGAVLGRVDVGTFSQAQIDQMSAAAGLSALTGAARCDVRLQRLSYATIGARGESGATATAALLIPSGAGCPGPQPLVAYTHGTTTLRAFTMVNANEEETQLLAAMLAAHGYAVVATDYLGLGGSDYGYHPFLHAASEASATVDSLRAARQALAADGKAIAPRVMLTGYSQGGHASMATQKVIEEALGSEFPIAAAGHMSGPYNLSGTMQIGISLLPTGTGGSTVFVPYALTGYQKAYGLYDDISRYIYPPYASDIDKMLPGDLSSSDLLARGRLPRQLGDLVTALFISDLQDTTTPLRRRLDENTLLGWTPRSPTLLCGGRRDPVVPFRNATDAQAGFATRGVTVPVVDVEAVPAFAGQFPETLSAEQQAAYHATTVPPLCLAVVRDQLFVPAQAAAIQP